MKVKVAEASGVVLNWLVAKCEGLEPELIGVMDDNDPVKFWHNATNQRYQFSTDWAQGGPIIEREFIHWGMTAVPHGATPTIYLAYQYQSGTKPVKGTTPLVAAMRCYCCAKLGEYVDIPEELCQQQSN